MKLRLAAPKPYKVRKAGGTLVVTIPAVVMLSVAFNQKSSLWYYTTPRGDLLLTNKKKA